MTRVLRAGLDHLFDYAGTFPPTSLELPEAFSNFLKYRRGDERLILNRLVVGAASLAQLAALLADSEASSVEVSVVAGASASRAEWDSALEAAAGQMTQFEDIVDPDIAEIVAFEARIPDFGDASGYFKDISQFGKVELFVELPFGEGQSEGLALLAEKEIGFAKARCGGTVVPSALELAEFLVGCLQLDLEFKLTAGLHHAYPVQVGEHGFLNVLAATSLQQAHELTAAELVPVLTARELSLVDEVEFEGLSASLEDVVSARELWLGIGSCSISEPWSSVS
jgi:hypothetical protein